MKSTLREDQLDHSLNSAPFRMDLNETIHLIKSSDCEHYQAKIANSEINQTQYYKIWKLERLSVYIVILLGSCLRDVLYWCFKICWQCW